MQEQLLYIGKAVVSRVGGVRHMGGPGFTGKEHTGVHSGVDAAGNVGVEPVPYHQSLFSGEAGQGETQFHHLGAGFSQVDRFPAGGGGEAAESPGCL